MKFYQVGGAGFEQRCTGGKNDGVARLRQSVAEKQIRYAQNDIEARWFLGVFRCCAVDGAAEVF